MGGLGLGAMVGWAVLAAALLAAGATEGRKLRCYDCESSDNCIAETCEGDYCVATAFTPKIGQKIILKTKTIKGCVSGSLLRPDIPDQCETVPESSSEVTNCFCSEKDFCNSKLEVHAARAQPSVVCACDEAEGQRCEEGGVCRGEFCSMARDSESGAQSRGCLNTSNSLIERRGEAAVVQPPLTGALHQRVDEMRSLLSTQFFLCAAERCNDHWPRKLQPRRLHCPSYIRLSLDSVGATEALGPGCEGQYCWNVNISAPGSDGLFRGYAAAGCMTLVEGGRVSDEFNEEGCMDFVSARFSAHACFHTRGQALPPRNVAEELSKAVEEEVAALEGKADEAAKPAKEAVERVEEAKASAPPPRNRQRHAKSANHRAERGGSGGAAGGSRAETHRELEAEEARGNAALVTVFVLAMVGIVLMGAVWKFNIHKKLFRARYETVAG